jgi:purine-nucleoside phosphorylase
MVTPHIGAKDGAFAKTVIMPGDPLRAKHIVETFLDDYELVTDVRGMLGFTGHYKGKRVSVMASGMGMPSAGIYSYELYTEYGVENIIRVGTAGSYSADLNVGDTFLAEKAFSQSSFAKVQNGNTSEYLDASKMLDDKIKEVAKEKGMKLATGTLNSSDVFYRMTEPKNGVPYWQTLRDEKGVKVVEMESFALYNTADVLGKNATCLVTVSDSLVTCEDTNAEQRPKTFSEMIILALETAIKL